MILLDKPTNGKMISASKKSFLCDYKDMEKIVAKCPYKK